MSKKTIILLTFLLLTLCVSVLQTYGLELWLSLWRDGAPPGRTRDITVQFDNSDMDITSIQFDFLFDVVSLSVENVERHGRSEVFPSIDWDSLDTGIRVALGNSEAVLPAGRGEIAEITVRVEDTAPRGSVIELVLTNIAVTDTLGNDYPIPEHIGSFTVPPYDFRFDFGRWHYWGGPGYTDVKVSVYLTSFIETSSIHFNVLYDTNVFTVGHAERTRGVFSNFNWHTLEEGVSIAMSDSLSFLQELVHGRIAYIYFNIDSNVSDGLYDLVIDNITVRDTSGLVVPSIADKVGEFYVGWPRLEVIDGRGMSGSSENVVQVDMENRFDVSSMTFDLLFDQHYLSVSNAVRADRTNDVSIFAWFSHTDGIAIVMAPFLPIDSGTGSIVDIFFAVKEEAPVGEYELRLSNVEIADFYGPIDQVNLIDGTFHVVRKNGDVNGDGVISIEDVITVVNIIIGLYEPTSHEFSAADCNDDDVVNALDVVCIVNIITGS